jgi:hypothetical protein
LAIPFNLEYKINSTGGTPSTSVAPTTPTTAVASASAVTTHLQPGCQPQQEQQLEGNTARGGLPATVTKQKRSNKQQGHNHQWDSKDANSSKCSATKGSTAAPNTKKHHQGRLQQTATWMPATVGKPVIAMTLATAVT